MNKIRDLTTQELKEGVSRCVGRLNGTYVPGWITKERTKEALEQYQTELQRRGELILEIW